MKYYLPDLPSWLLEHLIQREIDENNLQIEYFRTRTALGPIATPQVYQPVIEPREGNLIAIFHEPGAVHLVFKDEVAPNRIWDEKWREERRKLYGRTMDIESVEITNDNFAVFHGSGVWPANTYEIPPHASTEEPFTGALYSTTWNHCMSSRKSPLIIIRGGYQKMSAPVYNGSRGDAESYARTVLD